MSHLSKERDRTAAIAEPEKHWSQVARGLTGPAFIVGGLGVISKDLFLVGTVIVYFGCLILYLEAVFEPWALRKTLGVQCLLIALALSIPIWFTLNIVTAYGPLNLYSYALRKGNYDSGVKIGNIVWDSHFTNLTMAIVNPSNENYTDLELDAVPDTWLREATIVGTDLGCRLESIGGDTVLSTISKGGGRKLTMHRFGEKVEAEDEMGDVFTPLATKGGYRIRCDAFPGRSTLKIVFAAVSISPGLMNTVPPSPTVPRSGVAGVASEWANVKSDLDMLGERPNPMDVLISGDYKVKMRKLSIASHLAVDNGN
jgi:hypothetical protein